METTWIGTDGRVYDDETTRGWCPDCGASAHSPHLPRCTWTPPVELDRDAPAD